MGCRLSKYIEDKTHDEEIDNMEKGLVVSILYNNVIESGIIKNPIFCFKKSTINFSQSVLGP